MAHSAHNWDVPLFAWLCAGKTFIGVNLCELILKHSSETILCVCYTNHALDQFLESLLDKGITQIVRIGSRSKSKRLEQYNLRELAAKAKGQTWNMAESRRFGFLHNQLESVQKQVQHFAKLLTVTAGPAAPVGSGNPAGASAFAADRAKAANETWQQRSKQLQEQEQRARQKRIEAARMQGRLVRQDSDEEAEEEFDEWRDGIAPYLSDEYPDVHEQLLVPSGMTRTDPDYLWRLWLKGAKHKGSVDRWHASLQERKNSKAASSDGSWQTAKRTKHEPSSAPEFVASDAVKAASTALASGARVDPQAPELLEHIWSLPYPLRQLLASYWRSKLRSRYVRHNIASARKFCMHGLRHVCFCHRACLCQSSVAEQPALRWAAAVNSKSATIGDKCLSASVCYTVNPLSALAANSCSNGGFPA